MKLVESLNGSGFTVLLFTADTAGGFTWVRRRVKEQGTWCQKFVRKPTVVDNYNRYMAGVDRSDQLIAQYNVLIISMRWWKTLFFHLIDIAVVNSFILFKLMMARYPDNPQLQRLAQLSQLEFREELVKELIGLKDNKEVPVYQPGYNVPVDEDYVTKHLPNWNEKRRNCQVCYKRSGVEAKSFVSCVQCDVFLCFNKDRNCFAMWHSAAFNGLRNELNLLLLL